MSSRTRPPVRSSNIPRDPLRFRPVMEELENRVVLNAPGTGWTLNWFDEFNGTSVDYTKWSDYLPWNSACTGNNRYHDGDYANYMVNHDTVVGGQTLTRNVSVSGGQLHLRTQKVAPFRVGCKTFEYTGTMLTTGRGAAFRTWSSGYFEIRADLPSGRGNWPAFWMTNGWPPESDIMEYWPGHRSHQGLYGMDRAWHDRNDWSGALPSANWHTFGMEWGPGYQRYYLDDQLRYSTSGTFVPGTANPMYLLLNSSVAQSQSGAYSNANDNTLHVDYVRVYSYTPNASPRVGNPGFEAGSAGWAFSGSARVVDYNERTGDRALRIDGGSGGAEQVLTGLAPSTTYTLGGWARVSNGAAQARVGVRNYGGADQWAGTSNTGYTLRTLTFTTGPASTQATVYCSKPTGSHAAECDDLYLLRTPTLTAHAGTFRNLGFEDNPTGVGWTRSGSAQVVTSTPRSGARAMRMDGGSGAAEQVVTDLEPNTTYKVGGWMRVSHGSATAQIGVRDHGGAEVSASTSNTGYTYRSAVFTTGPDSSQATVFVRKPTGSHAADFDDLELFLEPVGTRLPHRTTDEDTAPPSVRLVVGNVGTAAGSWSLSASSSDQTLVRNSNLILGGNGVNRTLQITPEPDQFGTATITVTVSDPYGGSAARSFVLTVNPVNDAPVLDPIPDQTMPASQDILAVPLSATDVDGDPLTFTADAESLAYVLDQQLGLYFAGDYYEDAWGLGERWMLGAGDLWYFVLPTGELYGADGTFFGNVGASYWADPVLLHDAQPGQPRATLRIKGGVLTVDLEDGFTGSLVIWVTVSDGTLTDRRMFTVTVTS